MSKKAFQELCECICDALVRVNDKEQFNDIIERIKALSTDDEKQPREHKPRELKRNPEMFYYDGIQFLKMEERPNICHFSVSKGETLVLELDMDRTLNWVCKQSDNGVWRKICRFDIPRSEVYARTKLKKLAKQELEKPGYFAENYLPHDIIPDAPKPQAQTQEELPKPTNMLNDIKEKKQARKKAEDK